MRALTETEARQRAAAITVSSYDIELDLTQGGTWFWSTSTVRFTAVEGVSTFLELDCLTMVSATLDGRPLTFSRGRIALDELGGEHVVTVMARCAYTRTGEGLHRFTDPADGKTYVYAMAFLDDAQRIFACFDQPDLKAVFRLTVTAPVGDVVLSNTRADVRQGVHVFAPTLPLPTYLVTLASGEWYGKQVWHDGIELGVWCRASLAEHLDHGELLEITRQCLDFQQREFGSRYPFGDTYDQVFVPEFNAGAMENAGMVTFDEEQYLYRSRTTEGRRAKRAKTLAHEMSHMWFGDLVTLRWWDGIWLNESFAEYMGHHTVQQATRFEGAWSEFCVGSKASGYRADQLPTTHPITGAAADTRAALQNFDGISYAKGASVLRQLVAFVGEEVFFAGLRSYLGACALGNADLRDLLAELERASGRDLAAWSSDWLETSGVNTLRPRWEGDALVVVQEGDVLRDHVIAVGAYDDVDGRLRLRRRVQVEVRGPETVVADVAPAALVLLNDGDLTFAKIRLDERSLQTVLTSLARIEDGLARALCWSALWDATRDALLPAGAYVEAVLAGVGGEESPALVEALLAQAQQAAAHYAPPAEQDDLVAKIARECWAARVVPGSDAQLLHVRASVQTTSDRALLRDLLTGSSLPDGLVVDQELRWLVVRREAALGGLNEADIERELAADRTASGHLQAQAALAARPDPESKRRTWDGLLGEGVTTAQARTQGVAFWQRGQEQVLRPYVEEYVAVLPRLWSESSPQLADRLTSSLFPATLIEQQVHDQVALLLDRADLPSELRRRVVELLDDLRRALVAQQAG